jgi:hypothetical protein
MVIKALKYLVTGCLFLFFLIPICIWGIILGLLVGNSPFILTKIRDIWWNTIEQIDGELKV